MRPFATVEDMTLLWRPLTADESARAGGLLGIVSDILRQEASRVGKNLDERAASDEGFANVVKSVTVDVTARALMTSTSGEPMSQMAQSALGYSVSGTYLIPGGGLYVKKSELARLGLRRQKIGVIDLA